MAGLMMREEPGQRILKRYRTDNPYEEKVGYCRATSAGGFVFVAGTTAQGSDISDDVAEQCRSALDAIRSALEYMGSHIDQVLRVTYMLPDIAEFDACWPVLRDIFNDNPPAATVIECGLIDPKYRIEIEVTALQRPID